MNNQTTKIEVTGWYVEDTDRCATVIDCRRGTLVDEVMDGPFGFRTDAHAAFKQMTR